jgi:hypothetical protein
MMGYSMYVQASMLTPPEGLVALVRAGTWPRNTAEANQQNLKCLAPVERIQTLAPGEESLYLYPPPWASVAHVLQRGEAKFWNQWGCLSQIDPALSLVIGDFGVGSDAPIALDYRADAMSPRVLRLEWSTRQDVSSRKETRWVTCAANIEQFAERLGLMRGN